MWHLDLTLPTPAENLALDEALLDFFEREPEGEVLRFWEAAEHFVVVGYGNKVELEVNRSECEKLKIPVLRRCSGGGTVLQGPGCLNYALVLRLQDRPELGTISQTNRWIMERQKRALQELLGNAVAVRGHTDLTLDLLKFSGNAQRRCRNCLLFHGSFLLGADIELMTQTLRTPSREPDYRIGRSHRDFVTNARLSADQVKAALMGAWNARLPYREPVSVANLLATKYGVIDWNYRF